jgi:hypothetical protein
LERRHGRRTAASSRGWLLGNALCRKLISSLLGNGGVGKSALRYLQAISLATGCELTGHPDL